MTERKIQLPPRERHATFVPSSVDIEARTAELLWHAGAEVERHPWLDESYLEVLPVEAANLSRLNAGAPLLDAHRRDTVHAILGHVVRAWTQGSLGHAVVQFSEREDAERVFRDVAAGHIRGVSFAAQVHRFRRDAPAERGGLARLVATDWTPVELSLVPVGADPGATVRSTHTTHECVIEENHSMPEATPTPEVDRAEETTRAAQVRELEIRRAVADATRIAPHLAGQLAHRGDGWIADPNVEAATVRERLMNYLADEDERVVTRALNSAVIGHDHDSVPSLVDRMGSALASRAGGGEPPEDAREFRHRSLVDLARELLAARGVRGVRTMAPAQVLRAAHTTSDFPLLLADVGGKILRPAYEAAPAGVRSIVKQVDADDYHPVKRLQLGELSLSRVLESGEVTSASAAEAQEVYRVADFGRMIALSNQAIANDDLSAFGQLVQRFGWAAAEKERDELVTLLGLNSGDGPTMSDGVALFHATNPTALPHANKGTGVIAIAGLGAGLGAMRRQKGLSGVPIGVEPRFLVVPAALEVVARQFLAQITPAQSSNVNPFASMGLELVVDPRLDAVSTTAWYLFADPGQIGTLEIAFLSGSPGPRVETREGWVHLGAEVRCVHTFGVGAVDWRGAYKSTGQ